MTPGTPYGAPIMQAVPAAEPHRVRFTSPTGEEFFSCYEAPGMTKDPAKATAFRNLAVATRVASAEIYGDPDAFWNSERESAKRTRERMKGWKAAPEPLTPC